MRKQDVTLFFSLPLDEADWRNLAASHVTRVMLMLPFADQATLRRLASMGISVALRVPEDAYYDDLAPLRIRNQVQACAGVARVVVVVVGNEPENGADLHWGASSWAHERAYEHRRRFDAVRVVLQHAGFQVASPGWSYDPDTISEDGKPAPGRIAWREIVTEPQELPGGAVSFGYSDAQYNGFHLYQFNYVGEVDELRVKWGLKHAQEIWHKPLWIDEVNINSGGQLTRMRACIAMANLLLRHPLGARVVAYTPFVSNGTGEGWPIGYLMRDPQCYVELGQWMAG